jgi:alanine-glyoxylate transaminase/serine-glyoxylate transaminase/serine-pyruvate transaminase
LVLEHFDASLGTGLAKLAGKVFLICHLGDTNDLTIIATLAGVGMGPELAGIPHKPSGTRGAMHCFTRTAKTSLTSVGSTVVKPPSWSSFIHDADRQT